MADDVVNEMTDPNLDLEALVGAAEKVAKGPLWEKAEHDSGAVVITMDGDADDDGRCIVTTEVIAKMTDSTEGDEIADYLVLVQPVNILALVSRLQASEAEVERLKTTRWSAAIHADFEARATTAEAALTQRDEVIRGLREALETYDAKSAECPLNDAVMRKRIGDGPCPRCKAGPSEGCGVDVGASVTFINTARAALTASRTPAGSENCAPSPEQAAFALASLLAAGMVLSPEDAAADAYIEQPPTGSGEESGS